MQFNVSKMAQEFWVGDTRVGWNFWVWASKNQMLWCPVAEEHGCLSLKRQGVGRRADSLFSFLFYPGSTSLLSLLIKMLITAGNTPRNTHKWYLPALRAPLSPVRLVHKLKHHILEMLMAHPQTNAISKSAKPQRQHHLRLVECLNHKHGISQAIAFAH